MPLAVGLRREGVLAYRALERPFTVVCSKMPNQRTLIRADVRTECARKRRIRVQLQVALEQLNVLERQAAHRARRLFDFITSAGGTENCRITRERIAGVLRRQFADTRRCPDSRWHGVR